MIQNTPYMWNYFKNTTEKTRKGTMLKFYKVIAVPVELNGSESLVLKIKD
jgi:hypothetical protein